MSMWIPLPCHFRKLMVSLISVCDSPFQSGVVWTICVHLWEDYLVVCLCCFFKGGLGAQFLVHQTPDPRAQALARGIHLHIIYISCSWERHELSQGFSSPKSKSVQVNCLWRNAGKGLTWKDFCLIQREVGGSSSLSCFMLYGNQS